MPGGYGNIKGSDNPKPFSSTNQPTKNGRKPKPYQRFREMGYSWSKESITEAYATLAGMEKPQLEELMADPKATMLELTVGKAFIKASESGNFHQVKEIIEMISGKAIQKTEVDVNIRKEIPLIDWVQSPSELPEGQNDLINSQSVVIEPLGEIIEPLKEKE